MTATRQAAALALSLLICFGAAGLGSVWTQPSIGVWYAQLRKPAWTPPNQVFGPVWTTLYLGMAIAAWLVWRRAGWASASGSLTLFIAQLILNVSWSGIFFGLHRPDAAFTEIVLLWCMILATTIAFWFHSAIAGWLMAPYLAWVTYAAALNWKIWRLNA
jgi:tryptophan-rich sensory protein